MINVLISKKDDMITKITVNGHASYDEHGKDLVCAGVSSIVYGAINAFSELNLEFDYAIDEKNNVIEISFIKPDNQSALLGKMLVYQLLTIEASYQKYVKVSYK